MSDKTTAVTALAALNAAAKLQQALAKVSALYGVKPILTVTPTHTVISIDPGHGYGLYREALAGDIALILGTDLHPHIDPGDLWITLQADGQHNGHRVLLAVQVPPTDLEEAL